MFFFSSRRRHTRFDCDWSSDVCSSDLAEKRSMTITVPRPRLNWRERLYLPGIAAGLAITFKHFKNMLLGRTKVTIDRKSTRLNSSHSQISYAVFCLKKKKQSSIHRKLI